MIGEAREAAAVVCGETCKLYVYYSTKSVWIASGKFQGRDVEGRGRTFNAAMDDWKRRVESQEYN